MFRKVFVNTGSQIIAKIVSASVTLLVTILVSFSLGEQGYGEFTKIFVFIAYFYTVVDFGLNAIYVRSSGSQKEQIANFKILLALRLALAAFLVAAAVTISLFLPYDHLTKTGFSPLVKSAILLASLTIVSHSLITTANAFFQRNLRYDLATFATICGSLVILALTITTTLTSKSLFGYVASYVLGGITAVLVAYYLIERHLKQFTSPTFVLAKIRQMLKKASPIGFALILNVIYFRIDILILANTRDAAEVGVYGLAYQFFEASLAVPIFFANALYPLLVALYQKNRPDFKNQVRTWLKLLFVISLLQSLCLFLISYFIPVIYQGRFNSSPQALQILSLGIPFFYLSALLWHLLILKNRQKLLVIIYAIGLLFNLIFNLIFIPQYGYLAAATITVASEAIIMILLALALKIYD